jgi:hypothetical protein
LLRDAGGGIGQEGGQVPGDRLAGAQERGEDGVQVAAGLPAGGAFGFG